MKRAITFFLLFFLALQASDHVSAGEPIPVLMTEDGFEPREITIELGDTVTFVNKDNRQRWPASNIHPTHNIYPEFDPKQSIGIGGSWSFTFQRGGEWRYHDHILPHVRGTITVVGFETVVKNPTIASRFIDFIASLISKILSIFPFHQKQESSEPLGANSRLASQGVTLRGWNEVTNHDEAHLFGSKLFQERGIAGISFCNPSFAFGCYHGFADFALSESLEPLNSLVEGCSLAGEVNSGPWASCIHGIGHGVATYFDTIKLSDALNACSLMGKGSIYCYDGVLMEFATNASPSFYQKTKSDPLYPCSSLEEKYRASCARNQPAVLKKYLSVKNDQIATICLMSKDEDIRHYCIEAIGLSIGQEVGANSDGIIRECSLIKNDQAFAQCVAAAAGELVFQNYEGWETAAPAACEKLPDSFQESCLARVNETAISYKRFSQRF